LLEHNSTNMVLDKDTNLPNDGDHNAHPSTTPINNNFGVKRTPANRANSMDLDNSGVDSDLANQGNRMDLDNSGIESSSMDQDNDMDLDNNNIEPNSNMEDNSTGNYTTS
jgi:hypothetical protein